MSTPAGICRYQDIIRGAIQPRSEQYGGRLRDVETQDRRIERPDHHPLG